MTFHPLCFLIDASMTQITLPEQLPCALTVPPDAANDVEGVKERGRNAKTITRPRAAQIYTRRFQA